MSARDDLIYRITRHGSVETAEAMVNAHRSEALIEGAVELERIADEVEARVAEHYGSASGIGPGSAGLVREAARTLRALAGEKATASAATATPPLTTRRRYLYAAIQAHGSPITSAHAVALMHGSPWPTAGRNTLRKDLRSLTRAGLLTADDSSGRRTYTLNTTGTST